MSVLSELEKWAELIEANCNGQRLSLDGPKVAHLWKTLADAVSELKRLRALVTRDDTPGGRT